MHFMRRSLGKGLGVEAIDFLQASDGLPSAWALLRFGLIWSFQPQIAAMA